LHIAIEYYSFDSLLNWEDQMTTFLKLTLALAALSAPGTLSARSSNAGHTATLAAPVQADRLVAHGLLWRCADDQCTAPTGNSRPLVVCQALARTAGPVTSFGSGKTLFDAEQLARCNGAPGDARIATK
jgi:hypothetical protein